jgi:ATP adenylyltransferase
MEKLWAPWRIDYILSEKPKGCIFCDKPAEKKDEDNYILYRGRYHFIILNAFPYNNGHLMVAPRRHVRDLAGLRAGESADLWQALVRAQKLLSKVLSPQGYNIGINLGDVAGAGIPGHLHVHIVPRWKGDTNFMPTLAGAKIISQSLEQLILRLREADAYANA